MANLISPIGNRAFGYNLYRSLVDVDYPTPPVVENPIPEDNSPESSLLSMIFEVNPVTLLPSGDIAMFLSDKVHPDVKRFIETQLFTPSSITGDSSGDFSALSDDDILEFTRGRDESSTAYAHRVRDLLYESLRQNPLSFSSRNVEE